MCGRFTLIARREEMLHEYGVDDIPLEYQPRYNVAPGQIVAVVGKRATSGRGLANLSWGFVPRWVQDPKALSKPINARSETLLEKPMFRDAFRERRCLIPTTGFYEWTKHGKTKQPHYIRLKGGKPFAYAGLWDVWTGPDNTKLGTCCIITTTANDLLKPLHDRMPVILRHEDYEAWLDLNTPIAELQAKLVPYPAEEMEHLPVGFAVNRVANDGPECLAPAGHLPGLAG